MRSRTTRLTFGAAALIAIAAAVLFLGRSEARVSTVAASVNAFDVRARETADGLAELRAAQQAYVAAGQDADFWTGKVTRSVGTIRNAIVELRQSARTGHGRLVLMQAEATLGDFEAADRRTREYLKRGEQLMASDVIFQEGAAVATTAARQVEAARVAEQDGLRTDRAAVRKQQAATLAAVGAVTALIVVLLVPVTGAGRAETRSANQPGDSLRQSSRKSPGRPPEVRASNEAAGRQYLDARRQPADRSAERATVPPWVRSLSVLQTAADLCTEFGRIRDVDDLKRMLERTAEVMEARGLAVWLGSTNGEDLHPVFTHGYSRHLVAQLPAVPRSADNAVARAYRSGVQQIVRSGPGQANSAIVAPILTADGCIGALSAEIGGGTEGSEAVQTLTTIIAAHLAGVFAGASGGGAGAAARKSAQVQERV